MNLKNFVDLVEKFDNNNYGVGSSKNDSASDLAKIMYELKDKNFEEKKKNLEKIKDESSRYFINNLIERKLENKYIFLQKSSELQGDDAITFTFDLFNPFLNVESAEYSQKWHVLVSLLALLDVTNHDENYNGKTFRVKGDIEEIQFNENTLCIKGSKGSFTYTANWVKWVFKANQEYKKRIKNIDK